MEDLSRGKFLISVQKLKICLQHWNIIQDPFMKVMEMINKNVSMDFEALKKHARMNYWQMEEVSLVQIYPNT